MKPRTKYFYEFGPFRLDPNERALLRAGKRVSITPRVFDLLVALVQNSGRVLAKEEIMNEVWRDFHVEEANLTVSISVLRKALGEGARGDHYIETIPKCGYRFVAPVEEITDEDATGPTIRSIAVLPFKLLGVGSGEEYLGVGMADALITKLSNLKRVMVRPTSAVLRQSGHGSDIVAAGVSLCVDAVLDGCIQHAGDNIRVTVQFVSVSSGAPLWAEQFDQKFTDIFSLQDSISEQLARTLLIKLTADEQKRLRKHGTESLEAYQAYLKGRYYWNKVDPQTHLKALEYFVEAIRLDADFALAYAGAAEVYNWASIFGLIAPREAFAKSKEASMRALEIDDTLAEAHAALAFALMCYDWDWRAAERGFMLAIGLNPNYLIAHEWYGLYLAFTGRFDEAVAEINRTLEDDPLSLSSNRLLALLFLFARQYDHCIEQSLRTLEMYPHYPSPIYYLGEAYCQKGIPEKAIELYKGALDRPEGKPLIWALGHAYARAGRRHEAYAVLDELRALSNRGYISPYHAMLIHVGLGEFDEAFACLDEAYCYHDPWLIWLQADPRVDVLRPDPRFNGLLQRIGLAT
jgi:DNA-binding winged helix-turn-helix (wHTH) protein/tetratricopeptide (TPR) repeat protein